MSMSDLDFAQVIKSAYDPVNGALKTVPASGTVTEVELSHTDGDSVYTYGGASQQATAVLSSGASGEVIAPFSVVGMSSFQLYGNVVTTAVSTAVFTLQLSPEDSGSIWFSTSLTVTPSGSAGAVSSGTLLSGLARRARLIIASGSITSGTVQVYALAQA
jgi:hypothetical protein